MPSASRRTIEEELGLQETKVELGLQEELQPIPVGADDRFLVRKALGRGSMGTVYLADDLVMKREVALKGVATRRLEHGHLEQRLRREAQALAALRDENVVQAFDLVSTEAGELFIAMEYVPGRNLRAWQTEPPAEGEPDGAAGTRGLDQILDVYLCAARGLAAAHAEGIVHRDFKPDNVLLDERAELRVLVGDFGLAGADPDATGSRRAAPGVLTSTRGLLGTLAYMAPEQLRGERADARSDQHQFCVALWEALAGARPFADGGRDAETPEALPARPAAIPRWVHPVLVRGLSFVPDERFESMAELITALERRRRRRRALPWLALGAAVVVAGTGAAFGLQRDPCEAADASITETWTAEVRSEIDAAIRDPRRPYTAGVADFVVGTLDGAASQGARRAREICAARAETPVPERRLDHRQVCLERWTERFGRRVALLRDAGADASVIDRAHELVAPLGDGGGECRIPPSPIAASVQEAIERSEELSLLGSRDDARAEAEHAVELALAEGTACLPGAVEDAQGRPYSSELAAALYRLGVLQREGGASGESFETLTQAHVHAMACGDGHRFIDARVHAAKVEAVDLGRLDEATLALEEARVKMLELELSDTSRRRYEHDKALGLLAERRGEYERAREHYGAGMKALGEPAAHPIEAAKLLHDIGNAFQNEGRHAEAIESHARGLKVMSDALGEQHPAVRALAAKQALSAGQIAAAQQDFEAAREHLKAATRSGSPRVAALAYASLVQSEFLAGAKEQARAAGDELLELVESHDDLPPDLVARAKATVGQVLGDLGEPEGVVLLQQAEDLLSALGQAGSAQQTRLNRAIILDQLGRYEESRRLLESLEAEPGVLEGPLAEHLAVLRRNLDEHPRPDPTRPITPEDPRPDHADHPQ